MSKKLLMEEINLQQIEQICVDLEKKRDSDLGPINKFEADRLLQKAKLTTSDRFPRHVTRLQERYLIFPSGVIPGGHSYIYFHKPNENTKLSFLMGELIIYDPTFCTVNGNSVRLIDNRYEDYMRFEPSEDIGHKYLFRGIRGEEYCSVLQKGYIESNKTLNLEFQKDITVFTPNLKLAFLYAHIPFSIMRDSPTFDFNSYVLKIKRRGIRFTFEASSEVWVKGRVPLSKVSGIWEIRLGLASYGRFDLIENSSEIKSGKLTRHATTMIGVRKFSENEIKVAKEGNKKGPFQSLFRW